MKLFNMCLQVVCLFSLCSSPPGTALCPSLGCWSKAVTYLGEKASTFLEGKIGNKDLLRKVYVGYAGRIREDHEGAGRGEGGVMFACFLKLNSG